MMTHEMKLQPAPFAAIQSGKKIIESRLFDEKRQLIQFGDHILFSNIDSPDEKILTHVIGLLRYQTFSEMFTDLPISSFGGKSKDTLEKQIYTIYSKEDEARYGVVGIRITK